MKFSTTTSAIAVAIIALAGTAHAADYSANIELDNTIRSGSFTKDTAAAGLTQEGRVEFNATGKAGKDMTVSGKAAFLAKKDGTAATDDMWVSVNTASGSGLKLGRFEAFDLFPLAGDTVVNHAGTVYGANTLRGRNGTNVFHAAGTLAAGNGLNFELGLIETKSGNKGIRPVVSYANGPLSLAAGLESGQNVTLPVAATLTPATSTKANGFGLTAGYDFGGFKLTGNLAKGTVKATAPAPDTKNTSFALTAAAGPFAAGFVNGKSTAVNTDKVTTLYASYKLPLFDVKDAFITPAFSTSKATSSVAGSPSVNDTSVRVRINYTF